MRDRERRAVAALWSVQGVGPVTLRSLERELGPLAGLLDVPIADWLGSSAVGDAARAHLARFGTLEDAAQALEARLARCDYAVCFRGDGVFPQLLAQCDGAPPLLFHAGPLETRGPKPRVALVGTRRTDQPFLTWFRGLAEDVAAEGVTVVSGAAEGCDTAGHRGALDAGGETWAVLGCALEQADPHQARLGARIRASGGTLLSEYPPGSRPDSSTFVRRNRLISGCCDVVVVGRAPAGSGALHTAKAASQQGRVLFAVASDPWNVGAAGSHGLLTSGDARLCADAKDVLGALGLAVSKRAKRRRRRAPATPPEGLLPRKVLAALDLQPLEFDLIAAAVGAPSGDVQAALQELEIGGYVEAVKGRRYARLPAEDPSEVSDLLC